MHTLAKTLVKTDCTDGPFYSINPRHILIDMHKAKKAFVKRRNLCTVNLSSFRHDHNTMGMLNNKTSYLVPKICLRQQELYCVQADLDKAEPLFGSAGKV